MTAARRQPQRTCLGCRKVHDQKDLARFVRAPDGQVMIDPRNRLPGRGAYACWSRDCLEQIARRQAFARAFRQSCQPLELETLINDARFSLREHMANLIGMSRKSAQVVAGGNAVLEALSSASRFSVVIVAHDVSDSLSEKVKRKSAAVETLCNDLFSKAELGSILGRTEHSVVGLYIGQLADSFRVDLLKYRNLSGEN